MKIKILFFIFIFLACSSAPSDEEIEARVEAAVNQALEENAKSNQPTTTTTQPTTTTTTTLGPVVYYVHNGSDDSPDISLSSPRVKIKEIGGNIGPYDSCLFYVYNSNGSTEEVLTFIDNYFVRRVFLPNVNTIYLGGFSSGCSNAKIEVSYDYQPQQGLTTDSSGYYYVYDTYGDSDDFVLPANFRVGMEGDGTCVLYLKDSKTHQTIVGIVKSTYSAGFTRTNIGKETRVFLSTEGVTLACDDTTKLIFKP
jgi:hypothetical protein